MLGAPGLVEAFDLAEDGDVVLADPGMAGDDVVGGALEGGEGGEVDGDDGEAAMVDDGIFDGVGDGGLVRTQGDAGGGGPRDGGAADGLTDELGEGEGIGGQFSVISYQ